MPHLDARYGKHNINDKMKVLGLLFQKFIRITTSHKLKVIVMHGSLIGWLHGGKMLPWDDDIDVSLIGGDIDKLRLLNDESDSDCLIEVNPYSLNRSSRDWKNKIDARAICPHTGLFIDITFLTPDKNNKMLGCKSPHWYHNKDIVPLQPTTFIGSLCYVPNNIESVLVTEYGKNVLLPRYKNWKFENGEWIKEEKSFPKHSLSVLVGRPVQRRGNDNGFRGYGGFRVT